jgi:Ribbon-helix-helix protein, copG family
MNQSVKRTTVTASRDSLATLEAEAGRRGVSLSALLAEAVDEKAADIRAVRRPRVGMGRSTDGRSARELASEPVARPPS